MRNTETKNKFDFKKVIQRVGGAILIPTLIIALFISVVSLIITYSNNKKQKSVNNLCVECDYTKIKTYAAPAINCEAIGMKETLTLLYEYMPKNIENFNALDGRIYYVDNDVYNEMNHYAGPFPEGARFGLSILILDTPSIPALIIKSDDILNEKDYTKTIGTEKFHVEVVAHEFLHFFDKSYSSEENKKTTLSSSEYISNSDEFKELYKKYFRLYESHKQSETSDNYCEDEEYDSCYTRLSAGSNDYFYSNEQEFFACLMTDYLFYSEDAAEQMPKDLYEFCAKYAKDL